VSKNKYWKYQKLKTTQGNASSLRMYHHSTQANRGYTFYKSPIDGSEWLASRFNNSNNNNNNNNNNNPNCTIKPVIIRATGIVTRSLKKNLEAIPGKHSIDSLQKTAILGTSHIKRKVLQSEA
jgi:hypothetical protein